MAAHRSLCKFHWQKSVVLGFSASLVTWWIAIRYWNQEFVMNSRWNESVCWLPQVRIAIKLSSYVESEITTLKPHSPGSTIVCSMYCQRRKAGREPENKTTHSVLNVNQLPVCLYDHSDMKRWKFMLRACHAYVVTTCKLRAICYTSHMARVATIEILFAKNCRTYENRGLKFASEVIS